MSPNVFVPSRYVEIVHRLAAGVEPWDPVRRARHRGGLTVTLDATGERLDRHASNRFALRHHPHLEGPVTVRIVDGSRRVVPRRVELPVPRWDDLLADEDDETPTITVASRVHRIPLYPGAGYDAPPATAHRGRVVHGGSGVPVRWARVEAFQRGPMGAVGMPLGVAHGDDRGEFLLVVDPAAAFVGTVPDPLPVVFRVHARPEPPVPATPAAYPERTWQQAPASEPERSRYLRPRVKDPLWDLPVEPVPFPSPAVPAEYAESNAPPTPVNLPLSRVSSGPPLEFIP